MDRLIEPISPHFFPLAATIGMAAGAVKTKVARFSRSDSDLRGLCSAGLRKMRQRECYRSVACHRLFIQSLTSGATVWRKVQTSGRQPDARGRFVSYSD